MLSIDQFKRKNQKGCLCVEDANGIITLYRAGVGSHKIAELYKVNKSTIFRVLKKYNITVDRKGGKFKVDQEEKIKNVFSLQDINEKLDFIIERMTFFESILRLDNKTTRSY